jgi:subtilisin family serine protease
MATCTLARMRHLTGRALARRILVIVTAAAIPTVPSARPAFADRPAAEPIAGSTSRLAEFVEPSTDAYVDGEAIVAFSPALTPTEGRSAVARGVAGARVDEELLPDVHLVSLPAGTRVPSAVRDLGASPGIAWAEPNWIRTPSFTPNDPGYATQWGLPKANVDDVWDTTTGDGMTIAIVDTGVMQDHADLEHNMWSNPDETVNGADDDANGLVDDIVGWDFYGDDRVPEDHTGHGTHVAGIAAADGNNAIGISGVCPDCSIMALRAANNRGGLPVADVIAATRYAADEGADVINMSFGGALWSRAERRSVVYATDAGALVVSSAGNDSGNNDQLDAGADGFLATPSYPASYALPGIISVAASTSTDAFADFSNVGTASVDVAAPGAGIRSTWYSGSYRIASGTSMASPFVAGVAALLLEQNPGWSPVDVKNAVMNGAAHPNRLAAPRTVSDGRVDALASLQSADTSNATPPHDGTIDQAVPMRRRSAGTVSTPRDVNDIYAKDLQRGRTYVATLRVPARRDFDLFIWKPSAEDTWPIEVRKGRFTLLAAAGLELRGIDEVVRFRARTSGTYFIHVNAYRGDGSYTVAIRRA